MSLLLFYVIGTLSISFVCSVLEATLLSISIAELTPRKEVGDKGAGLLLELKSKRIDDAISSILTLNTIAHTAGATLAGAQAAVVFEHPWVGVFSAVFVILVLVLTEIVPKTLGTVHASKLAGIVGRTIWVLILALTPVLMITGALTRLLTTGEKAPVSRGEIGAMVRIAHREGTLAGHESRALSNMLQSREVRVEHVMTPRTVAAMLPAESPASGLLAYKPGSSFSRVPIYEGNRDHVVGYVLQREVLSALAHGKDPSTPLSAYVRKVIFIPETATISQALKQMLARSEHMAMVGDEYGGVSGLVTLEDLIETVLGTEIVDESDRVPDLRTLAAKLRSGRLRRAGLTPAPDKGEQG